MKRLYIRKILMLSVLFLGSLFFLLTPKNAAAETNGSFFVGLKTRSADAWIESSQSFSGEYSFDVGFYSKGGDVNGRIMTVKLGLESGTHFLQINIMGRSISAYIVNSEGEGQGSLPVVGNTDIVTVAGNESGYAWIKAGMNFVFRFVVTDGGNTLDLYYGKNYTDSLYGKHNSIDISSVKGITDGKAGVFPKLDNIFDINSLKANDIDLNLNGEGDVILSDKTHFNCVCVMPSVVISTDTVYSAITPIEISSQGFGSENETLFEMKIDFKRTGPQNWMTYSSEFGVLLGLQSSSDNETTQGVVSFLNVNRQGTGNTKITVGTGNGSGVMPIKEIGTPVNQNPNDLNNGYISLSLKGKTGGIIEYVYTEGLPVTYTHSGTIQTNGFDGKIGVVCKAAFNPQYPDTISVLNTSLSINEAVLPDSVEIPESLSLRIGQTHTINAVVYPENTTDKSILFESSDESVVTVDGNGKLTAVSKGNANITVRTNSKDLSAVCLVNVYKGVEGVELAENSVSLFKNTTHKLNAEIFPEDADNKNLLWISSDESVAEIGQDGTVSAKNYGKTTITVYTEDGNFSDKCEVNVKLRVTAVVISSLKETMAIDDTVTLYATIYPGNAENKNYFWESSDNLIAEVDSNGNVTAKNIGEALISVISEDGGYFESCHIRVIVPIQTITLNYTEIKLKIGETALLNPTFTPENASYTAMAFMTDNNSVVKTEQNGNLTAIKEGKAIITVTSENGITATCKVTVISEDKGCETNINANALLIAIFIIILILKTNKTRKKLQRR